MLIHYTNMFPARFLFMYNKFNTGYRNNYEDIIFTATAKRYIKEIMKRDNVSRETAGMTLVLICKNNDEEALKDYVQNLE